jgi:hypothetical protein
MWLDRESAARQRNRNSRQDVAGRDETTERMVMRDFVRRFLMHYGIYRRYPLGRVPALRNAWRIARV